MKIDILIKAILKTLLVWVVVIAVTSLCGGMVIYGVSFLASFIVSHNLAYIILTPIACVILCMFGVHINHTYKEML